MNFFTHNPETPTFQVKLIGQRIPTLIMIPVNQAILPRLQWQAYSSYSCFSQYICYLNLLHVFNLHYILFIFVLLSFLLCFTTSTFVGPSSFTPTAPTGPFGSPVHGVVSPPQFSEQLPGPSTVPIRTTSEDVSGTPLLLVSHIFEYSSIVLTTSVYYPLLIFSFHWSFSFISCS